MTGYDIDGVLTAGVEMEPNSVVISGRTWAEYDDKAKRIAQQCPVYIRGTGTYGNAEAAGQFKALMIKLLGVTKFYEDDPYQADLIHAMNPDCEIVLPK
jgi:hypothetical protein